MPIVSDMSRTFVASFPSTVRQLQTLGERLKLARLRRQISTVLMAERVGVSRDTLHRLEQGDPTIALGTYARVLRVLGLDKDLDTVARDDDLGRKLQDQAIANQRPRSSSRRGSTMGGRGPRGGFHD